MFPALRIFSGGIIFREHSGYPSALSLNMVTYSHVDMQIIKFNHDCKLVGIFDQEIVFLMFI